LGKRFCNHRWFLTLLLLGSLVAPASAYRREYKVTLNGERKKGSEVCFFRGGKGRTPFSLFFSSPTATCLPADQVLDLPPGLFHAYARHRDGYASEYRDYFVYDGPPVPEKGYEVLETPLQEAGFADFAAVARSLRPGQALGVWLAPTVRSSGMFLPLVPGETTILVPAGIPFVPLLIEGEMPVAVGNRLSVDARQHRAIPPFDRSATSVVAWVKVDEDLMRNAAHALPPPEIVLVVSGEIHPPLDPLAVVAGASYTLLFFKGIPSGEGELKVQGQFWTHYSRPLRLAKGVAVELRPLVLAPGGSVRATWGSGSGELRGSQSACGGPEEARTPLRALLAECRMPAADGSDGACTPVDSRVMPFDSGGVISFEGIPAGRYRLTLDPPFAKAVTKSFDVTVGDEVSLDMPLDTFNFFGTVKLNGVPVHARLFFETGSLESDESGTFHAALAADPILSKVTVRPCADDRSFRYILRSRIQRNEVLDIDLRAGSLDVAVVDEQGVAIAGAAVRFAPVKELAAGKDVGSYYVSAEVGTDEKGHAGLVVPTDLPLTLCATHPDHLPRCNDPMMPADTRTGTAEIRMDSVRFRGRIEGSLGDARLAWVDPAGRLTEAVTPEATGVFAFRIRHSLTEHLVYVSDQKPLTVFPMPADWQGSSELILTLPAAPVRTFRVTVPAMKAKSGYVGLWVGNLYVPLQQLAEHLDRRGIDLLVLRGRALVVKDIAETGPISVAFAPEDPVAREFVDPFTTPQYAGIRRYPVTSSEVVIDR
jgi:hypothetical protein